ncbi:HpcH/HpaI aldolase/citrate lyase family protein, partial [Pseudomonas salomonii]|uniref:HpcH/HpaI aldolase/citrate lyase family protein n=1 Tax=Pseudomonas salomonii TaxID=191391 RepID=UPI001F387DA3
PERFSKALASGADAVIVDFEDAVEEPLKRQARDNLGVFLHAHPQAQVWVRINAPEHAEHFEDVAFCKAHSNVAGVLLPKVESAAQVAVVAAAGKVIWPIIESAKGLLAVAEIAHAPQVERLSFGGLDLALDLNLSSGSAAAQFALDQARLALIVHSRAAGLVAPLDGVHPAIDDPEGLRGSIRHAYEMGFAGALCIHPKQVTVIHQALAPSAEDLAWAKRVVEAGGPRGGAGPVSFTQLPAPETGVDNSYAVFFF